MMVQIHNPSTQEVEAEESEVHNAYIRTQERWLGMAVHPLIPVLGSRGRESPVSSKPVWSTKRVPGQPGLLHGETPSQKAKNKQKRKERKKRENPEKYT